MRARRRPHALAVLGAATLAAALLSPRARAARTPEQEALWLLPQLKPVPNEQWLTIASARVSERYEIVAGDTLWDISKRLFGDARYWPKIWSLNNDTITNPHLIRPGNFIQFSPGSGTTMPSVLIGENGSSVPLVADASNAADPGVGPTVFDINNERPRSQEWRKLPRQAWELAGSLPKPANVDSDTGIDQRSKIRFKPPEGYELPSIASTDEIEPMGEIVAGRMEASGFAIGDNVFVQARSGLQVGDFYSVVGKPVRLSDGSEYGIGYSYMIRGRVKIIGVKDGLFVGEVTSSMDRIERGMHLIAVTPKIKELPPIAGPSPVEAHLILDRTVSTFATSQFKFVYIDRGRDDGIREGMVFRAFQKTDPKTKERFTDSDFIASADVQVVQTSERVSSGIILSGIETLQEGAPLTLLTDVSDVGRRSMNREKTIDFGEADASGAKKDSVETIDALDVGGGLGAQEAKELRQLERWDEQGEQAAPAPAPEETQPPLDSELQSLDEEEVAAPEAPPAETAPPAEAVPPAETAPPPPPASGDAELESLEDTASSAPTEEATKKKTQEEELDELLDE